ncbi:hypothetical protein HK097_005800, partial [Rhizophlyctis rosea]
MVRLSALKAGIWTVTAASLAGHTTADLQPPSRLTYKNSTTRLVSPSVDPTFATTATGQVHILTLPSLVPYTDPSSLPFLQSWSSAASISIANKPFPEDTTYEQYVKEVQVACEQKQSKFDVVW